MQVRAAADGGLASLGARQRDVVISYLLCLYFNYEVHCYTTVPSLACWDPNTQFTLPT